MLESIRKKIDLSTLLSMIKNFIIKGFSYICMYIYTPMLLKYLGSEEYGLWATVLSVMTWINMCDIGIGSGLRNILTTEISKGLYIEAKKSITTAYVMLSFVSLLMLSFIIGVTATIGWNSILNTTIDVNNVMIISGSSICIGFVLSIVNVILYSLQSSEQVAFINLIGNMINIIGIVFVSLLFARRMEYVAVVYGMSMGIPLIIKSYSVFKKYDYLSPSIKCFDKKKIRTIVSLGGVFFILQIGGLMLSVTDNIIITRIFGSVEVTSIELSNKLLSILKGFFFAMIIPVWARTNKAMAEKDYDWIRNMYKHLLLLLGVFGLGIMLTVICFHPLMNIWIGHNIDVSTYCVCIIAIGVFSEMITAAYSYMLNGLNMLGVQLFIALIQIIVNIPLSIILAKNTCLGAVGVKMATTILFSVSAIIYIFYTKHSINKLGKIGGTR